MSVNIPNLDLVNIKSYTKTGKIISIFSQAIERKEILTSTLLQICEKAK